MACVWSNAKRSTAKVYKQFCHPALTQTRNKYRCDRAMRWSHRLLLMAKPISLDTFMIRPVLLSDNSLLLPVTGKN